ncbi:GNAT family N-acetyltransferase [Enhygromyxa salina]|uniref:Putative acetyltransferase n=1 Tax=Enhygromyxa salina TaxID=215803 RepID=A0A2S9YLU7_9BACT|nr:GNAT family N-acetyltransferase [Enhygromyxa salina]PRQ06079.1 putative acetyltransferase [Enhygromyxa salina]
MRTNRFPWPREQALALLAAADTAHFALTGDDGQPMLRCVHVVVDDDALCFHASPVGNKSQGVGRSAVAAVERVLAIVPSYAFDPERACPATTWYQSVQVRGVLERIEDPPRKARVLQRLMERLQPEGGHVPIEAEHPLYRRVVAGLDVLALPLTELDGRAKLGQNRSDEQICRALTWLWTRAIGPADTLGIDARIEAILDARPELPIPEFLRGPTAIEADSSNLARLCCRPRDTEVDTAVALVEHEYWNVTTSPETSRLAHLRSPVWVGARDHAGQLIATARASTDGAKHAWVYDVAVDPRWRGRGVGRALLRLLLDHPLIREVHSVHLQTRDAAGFYAQLGFVPYPSETPRRHVRIQA